MIEEKIIKISDEEISLRKTSGRGHPIVLLHGIMDSAESWDYLGEEISRPTLALDLPGFGKSSLLESEDIEVWAKIYLDALDREGIERFYLLGHSLGGALAKAIADLAPDRVISLLLVAPAGFCSLPLSRILTQRGVEGVLRGAAPVAMGFDPLVNLLYREIFSYHKNLSPDLKIRLKEDRRKMIPGIRQGMHIISDLSKKPFETSSYEGPAYALWGDHDHLVPREKAWARIQDIFPEAEITVIKDTGHHPQEERPRAFRQWVQEKTGIKKLARQKQS